MNPYVSFDGRCEEAFRFYEKSLGAKIVAMMTWGESPMAGHVPPEWKKKIIHATLSWNGQTLGGADSPPLHYRKPQGVSVTLDIAKPAEAERVFKALSAGGEVQMPIQETFWALRFGMCVDKFGTPWMINCGKPQ